jgi:vesicle-associated membrane protein 4
MENNNSTSTTIYYEPYNTNQPYTEYNSNSSLQTIHDELEESKDLLKDNIEKITHRDQLIINIEEKSENLSESSQLFKAKSSKLKRHEWFRAYMCEIILVFVIVIIIIILLVVLFKK